jgi:manganese transport protein
VPEHFGRPVSAGLWIQAELIAMATDLAGFVGAAIGLNLPFHVPLFPAGVITAAAFHAQRSAGIGPWGGIADIVSE